MKSFLIFGCITALAVAQRPFYAGTSAKVYPELANRFKDPDSSSDSNTILNRVGDSDSKTTSKIPIDARGDVDLVNRLNTWPRENRPFWLLNADAIERHRNPAGTRNQPQQQILSRSNFDDEYYPFYEYEIRAIRPKERRPAYLGTLGRR
ncbi:hypothetical protein NQ315_010131 [Exocentrus adspersus]|uniref:Uncharacterized protein n=1 Tax=Exocentrus adspersus TaxID=1586481 RepID=A0AAV8WB78_9CUCU|nr:hypothetical protein NQ315_010131 [Exocentrus adspersus]